MVIFAFGIKSSRTPFFWVGGRGFSICGANELIRQVSPSDVQINTLTKCWQRKRKCHSYETRHSTQGQIATHVSFLFLISWDIFAKRIFFGARINHVHVSLIEQDRFQENIISHVHLRVTHTHTHTQRTCHAVQHAYHLIKKWDEWLEKIK